MAQVLSGIIPELPAGDQHLPTQRSLCHPFHLFNFDGGAAETPSTRRLGVGRLSEVVGPGWLCAATREVPGKRHLVRLVVKYLGIEGYGNFYTSHEASAQPVKAALGHPILTCPIQPDLTQFHLFIDIFDIGDTPTCVG